MSIEDCEIQDLQLSSYGIFYNLIMQLSAGPLDEHGYVRETNQEHAPRNTEILYDHSSRNTDPIYHQHPD